MKKIFTACVFLSCICSGIAASDCFSILSGDTLKIGNNLIERVFLWNNGNLVTKRVIDKKTGKTFEADGTISDFIINKEDVSEASYRVDTVQADTIKAGYLVSIITFKAGDVEVERSYKVYDNVPAIAIDTRLRGHLHSANESAKDGADRSNIEKSADMKMESVSGSLDGIKLKGNHWKGKAIEFRDVTDWYNNLVNESEFISYRKDNRRGNLLFIEDLTDKGGLIFLKEAPCSNVQLNYSKGDFISDFGDFRVVGTGLRANDISEKEWTPAYSSVMLTYGTDDLSALKALRNYQKKNRILDPVRDEMVMMNTWGDRSRDEKVNEEFCLAELEKAGNLGISVFQIDDGWQAGKSANSAFGGSFKDIYSNSGYWKPDSLKYPHGLKPIVDKGHELGIRLGLWFNPSVQNDFEDWEKDAGSIIDLWKEFGIKIFKIDGVNVTSKKGEMNLRKMFDKVLDETDNEVIFNLDATAGRRMGYHYFNEYGNIFLENRYTDWGNYYPYQTLRNLWQLSKYVPAERIQVEFLNKWRNEDKYADDPFAPFTYSFPYLFAITMAGQPLAWMEASNLPDEAFEIKGLIDGYRKIMHEFHSGIILPIGSEPSGRSWTGFQSITDDNNGFLLVFRENNELCEGELETWFSPGEKILLTPVLEEDAAQDVEVRTGRKGLISLVIENPNDFKMYRYSKI